MIKQAIQKAANLLGYRIVRASRPPAPPDKYAALVGYYGELARAAGLPGLPPMDERRRDLAAALDGTTVPQAMVLMACANEVLPLEGDVCEFGLGQGATSALLANEIRATDKRLWLFDSFQGLPKPTAEDRLLNDVSGLGSIERYEGVGAQSPEPVAQRLREVQFPPGRTEIVAGFVEETLRGPRVPRRVALAFVDVDFYRPVLTALRFLDGATVAGGGVVVHDYGYFSAGAKQAVDEFVEGCGGRFSAEFPQGWCWGIAVLRRAATGPARGAGGRG